MSMSMYVKFLRSSDDEDYKLKLKALKALQKAGIVPPKELSAYFGEEEDEEYPLEIQGECNNFRDEMSEGLEINMDDIPSGVSKIRFFCSW